MKANESRAAKNKKTSIGNFINEVIKMGKDRQEKKLKKMRKVESDRDQALHFGGATRYEKEGEKGKPINES